MLSQKIKNRITLRCNNFTSGYISKELKTVLMTYLFTAVLFIIGKKVEAIQVSNNTGCIYLTLLNYTLKMVKMVNFMFDHN